MSINKVILIGNLGSDPELRNSDKEKPFCNLNVATNHSYADSAATRQTRTEWHHVVCFGVTAETCARFLKKGRQIYVEGRIQSQRWQDKEGKDRYSNRIVANVVQFLGPKPVVASETVSDGADAVLSEAAATADDDIPW